MRLQNVTNGNKSEEKSEIIYYILSHLDNTLITYAVAPDISKADNYIPRPFHGGMLKR